MTRRTHCPQGRPLYRADTLPDTLATRTMLTRMRRKLAAGQQPVATYRGLDYAPLYTIADSIPLPEQTPKQKARWDAARTCARCGDYHDNPLHPDHRDGRRLDDRCRGAERLAEARPSRLALRLAATSWARQILTDPDTVVLVADVVGGKAWRAPVLLYAAGLDGAPLVDVLVWPNHGNGYVWSPAGWLLRPPAAVRGLEVIPHLYPLVGCRTVHLVLGHWNDDALSPIWLIGDTDNNWVPYRNDLLGGGAIRQDPGDCYSRRWREWLCLPASGAYRGEPGLTRQPVTADWPGQGAAAVLAGLQLMAADDHPDGPATCPVLPATGLDPCGNPDLTADGVCHHHSDPTTRPAPPTVTVCAVCGEAYGEDGKPPACNH